MSPLPAKIRRLLPFGIPLLIALLMIGMVHRRGDKSSETPETADASAKTKVFSADQRKVEPVVAKRERVEEPPNNPLVAKLIEDFERGDCKIQEASIRELTLRPMGKTVQFKAAGMELNGTVDSRSDASGVVHIGVSLNEGLGRFQISLREDDRIQASLMFNGESQAFAFQGFPQNGAWDMVATTVSGILCSPADSVYPGSSNAEASYPAVTDVTEPVPSSGPVSAPPILNSNPGSTYVLYCDFDGESVTHPLWNNGVTIDAKPHARANDVSFVTKVWQRTSEDFSPFDLNVTTDRAVFDAADVSRRVHCVITPTTTAMPGSGGVAYLQSFGQDIPCWAFNPTEDTCADTISHEVGHTLGLNHDGLTTGVEYYGGQGSGATSWAPIMGAFFADGGDEELTQWSKGEYPDANNPEDDLSIITSDNGFGYRVDDKGSTRETATPLAFNAGKVEDSGIIERTKDQDWFSFSTSGGSVLLNVNVTDVNSSDADQRGSNLAVSAELYDSAGVLVQSSNPVNALDASISFNIPAGDYTLKLDGAGRGDLTTGFSDYDSLGQYTISGSVPQSGLVTVSPATQDFTSKPGSLTLDVSSDVTWSWSCDQTWVTSTEAASQTGNQKFDYSIAQNTTEDPRTAVITFSVGGFTVTHTIHQDAPTGDDYGDDIYTAALVEQVSATIGKIETPKDVDVFRIDVKGFGDLTVKATGTTDTFGEILDFSGVKLASNDNAAKPNFKIIRSVSTGTYYIRVRHALKTGIGSYGLVCSFKSKPALAVSPEVRTVGPNGGSFTFDVTSNTSWSWSSDAPWLVINEAVNQNGGQSFGYTVPANPTTQDRVAHVTLTTGSQTAVHEITQQGSLSDDHGDNRANATSLPVNGALNGNIEFGADLDVFRIVLEKRGQLTVQTIGFLDTFGQLLDASGEVLAANDDYTDDNFGIVRSLNAGTYFVKVRHFNKTGMGSYRVVNSFTPARLVDAKYNAGYGGSLQGDTRQTLPLGDDGTKVTAVPNNGFYFLKWSDGRTDAIRKDLKIQTNLTVTAQFARSMSVSLAGGDDLVSNEVPGVDYGKLAKGQSRKKTFVIHNDSDHVLTELQVSKSGVDPSDWKLGTLDRIKLNPGQSAQFSATFKASSLGNHSAILIVTAKGAGSAFKIHVIAQVESQLAQKAAPDAVHGKTSIAADGVVPITPEGSSDAAAAHAAPVQSWITASPDGFFRYHFRRPAGDRRVPGFLYSSNGVDWNEADVVSIERLSHEGNWEDCEATLSLAEPVLPFVLISEIPTSAKNP